MLAGDFIRDEGNTWWFINIKAFKLAPDSNKPQLANFTNLALSESMI